MLNCQQTLLTCKSGLNDAECTLLCTVWEKPHWASGKCHDNSVRDVYSDTSL